MSSLILTWVLMVSCSLRSSTILLTSGLIWLTSCTFNSFCSVSCSEISVCLMGLTLYLMGMMVLTASYTPLLTSVLSSLGFILQILFSASTLITFYICFESSLLPMAAIILGWGAQPERLIAGVYMLFYTIISALPFMGVVLGHSSPTTYFQPKPEVSWLIPLLALLPFLIKSPMFLLHLWLPKAHVEAPVYGSMVLAGVLLKIGGYGLWVLHKWFYHSLIWMMMLGSMVGGALCSLITMTQTDLKALIAYSSIVHMAMVTFSLLFFSKTGNSGALAMMLGHGVCSSGLFLTATLKYSRVSSRSLLLNQGGLSVVPCLTLLWVLLISMNFSCPPSVTLLSEVLAFYLSLTISWSTAIWMGLMMISSLLFSVMLFYFPSHGQPTPQSPTSTESMNELLLVSVHASWWILSPLVFYVLE